MLTIEKITTREGFHRLGAVWNRTLERSAANKITLTWEWLSTWWDVFSEGRELYLLVVRDSEEIIAIAPLLRRVVQRYGLIPFRRLEFLASGEDEADEICSDYLDFILVRGREEQALEALFAYLQEQAAEWDEILLTDIAGQSASLPILNKICQREGVKLEELRNETCIYVSLPSAWETLVESISPTFRQRIKKDRKVASEIGAKLRVIDSAEVFEENFRALIELHQARWTSRGEPGVFSSSKFTRFHETLAPLILPKGWIRLFMLVVDEKPVAALYDFVYDNRMYYYQSGFDIAHDRIRSPGLLIRSYAIENAIESGLQECDFLKGDTNGYKAGWRGETRNILQLRLSRAQSKEAIYTATTKLFDGLRQIRRALKRVATPSLAPN
jgi:CelD/BcsL family acetyltransferase involved in cellulose biosynthesis